MYGQRDDILIDSRRPGGASRDIRLTDNTYVILRWSGFADSSKRLKPASTRGRISSSHWRTHKRLAIPSQNRARGPCRRSTTPLKQFQTQEKLEMKSSEDKFRVMVDTIPALVWWIPKRIYDA